MRHTPTRRRRVLCLMGVLLAACASEPWGAETPARWCGEGHEIYAPIPQGPDESEDASEEALECIVAAHESGDDAGLEFTYMGVEGQRYAAMLHAQPDGTVDFYVEAGIGWDAYLACSSFEILDPGTVEVDDCERTPGDPNSTG